MLAVGDKAPLFTLQNQHDEPVSLTDFKDNKFVVVYFYPKASTPGCTVQACGLRDIHAELAQLNVAVLGLSPDSPKRLANFTDKQQLNFTLLADEDHAVAEQFGVWQLKKFMGKEFMGVLRTTFVIDNNGVIVHVMDDVKTKTHHDDLIAVIKHLLSV